MITLPGADVSAYQGPPADWKPQAGNISWAGVKISELSTAGPYVNPDAAADMAYLKAGGKVRVCYLFGHPDTSATASVALFAGELAKLGMQDGDAVALDLEVTQGLPASKVAAWGLSVLRELETVFGRRPVLYTFLSFAETGNCAGMGAYPLWIADPSSAAGKPRVPAPWKTWAAHQWRITGPLDRDVAAFGSQSAMRAALGRKAAPIVTETSWTADGQTSLTALCGKHPGWTPAGILRRTAVHDGKYGPDMAAFLNGVFEGKIPATFPVPAGAVLWVPAP